MESWVFFFLGAIFHPFSSPRLFAFSPPPGRETADSPNTLDAPLFRGSSEMEYLVESPPGALPFLRLSSGLFPFTCSSCRYSL